jgi:hypothetical protein
MLSDRNNRYARMIRSWWGRSLFGGFIGGLLMAWSGVEDPLFFFGGIVVGALVMFFLGRLE